MADDCLIVHLKLSDGAYGTPEQRQAVHALSSRLKEAVTREGIGEFDGDEFGDGECTLYFYGPDSDKLFQALLETLESSPLSRGGYALKQYDFKRGVADQRIDFK